MTVCFAAICVCSKCTKLVGISPFKVDLLYHNPGSPVWESELVYPSMLWLPGRTAGSLRIYQCNSTICLLHWNTPKNNNSFIYFFVDMHKIYIDYIYNILNLNDEKFILLLSFYMKAKDLWQKHGIKKTWKLNFWSR